MTTATRWRYAATLVAVAALATVTPGAQADDDGATVEVLAHFDPAAGQFAEGVAADPRGNVYVSLSFTGEVWRSRSGGPVEPFGAVPDIGPADFGVLGLTVDRRGDVFVAALTEHDASRGVWRLDRDTGAATKLPGTEVIAFPNALAFDRTGKLYVTDSIAGKVWRIDRHGAVTTWSADPLLEGDGSLQQGFPIGANGIVRDGRRFIVANLERGLLVELPIRGDGSAGTARVAAEIDGLPDGLDRGDDGEIFVALIGANQIARVDLDDDPAEIEIVAAGPPLQDPASVAVDPRDDDRVYVANFAIFTQTDPNLAVVHLDD